MASSGNLYGGMFDLNGFEVATGYNGKSGWIRDSRNGLRTITGDASKDFQAEVNYRNNRWLNAKNDKSKLISGGTSAINGKNANVVTLNTTKGIQIKMYFDAVTGLLLREELPQGETTKVFDYDNYKPINGIQTAFKISTKLGNENYEINLSDVQYNQSIAKNSFDFPQISNEPLPDIKSLLQEIRTNADKVDEILENYSYTETNIERELDNSGNLVEKKSEKTSVSFYKGYRIRRTIEKILRLIGCKYKTMDISYRKKRQPVHHGKN